MASNILQEEFPISDINQIPEIQKEKQTVENKESILCYTNELYKDVNWLNEQIKRARWNIDNHKISTVIIENIYYFQNVGKNYHYHPSGVVIADKDWEYYSSGKSSSFCITDAEAEYIIKNKSKLYKFNTGEYYVGTTLDMIQ